MEGETYCDDIKRMFCTQHRREYCHECGYDFRDMNRDAEADAGLRQPKTELEQAAEFLVVCNSALHRMAREMGMGPGDPAYDQTKQHQIEKQLAWNELLQKNNISKQDANAAMRKALEKEQKDSAERQAITQAWAKENPGKRVMEFGGPETQRLYDQFAAAPTLSDREAKNRVDRYTCSYCGKASAERLLYCGRCRKVCYCGEDCKHKAWKAHKRTCVRAAENAEKPKSIKVLTWKQVEAHEGLPVPGKTLEVRALVDESMIRQVFQCKDREGTVHRVAVYTTSGKIPGLKQGVILRWKNPRFHYFMDGSAGARIEDDDLENITISSS